MNKEEYDTKKAELEVKYKQELNKLMKEYAISNSPANIGDIVTDHIGSIRVEAFYIKRLYEYSYPSWRYTGTRHTKTGKPFKSGKKRYVWHDNILKINGKDIER